MSVQSDFPMIQNGDSGESVEYLQNLLNSYEQASLETDGEFGEGTEIAVKAFQEKSGIDSDGIVGAETWAALQALVPAESEAEVEVESEAEVEVEPEAEVEVESSEG